ncbi:N-acetyltransferase [Jannaschia pagri]|uniref:N-acetyltransferase n=1 Tax=Jannaschia pagri TaxID=2829797 RepID=A0ABQ4NKH3_9RHOB|nr:MULTISPECIES: GNAT family N-acetyltransferase [unclassified Jannaschia]GIT91075.1 N-acetyltransferase [Jannaschia sp. AI_61]GIT94907.1 N-acetyltransferase [Jannaschia sp. AI_62]
MLKSGFHPIASGHVAAVVTHLHMPRPTLAPPPPDVPLRQMRAPDVDWYRDLFTRVGALDWLWFSRLKLDDSALREILTDERVEIRVLERDGQAEGLVELDFRTGGTCELAFFGLTEAVQGRGLGRAMMRAALHHGFARDVPEITVHTCTFDSPIALPFYMRSGFVATRQEIEVVPDPRADGTLPQTAAPHVPYMPERGGIAG